MEKKAHLARCSVRLSFLLNANISMLKRVDNGKMLQWWFLGQDVDQVYQDSYVW